MDLGVSGKRYLIGGGSNGLAFAIVQVLVEEGARVLLMSRNADELRAASYVSGTTLLVDGAMVTAVP